MENEPDIPPPGPDADPLDALLRLAQWPDDDPDPLNQLLRVAQWPEPPADPVRDRRYLYARLSLVDSSDGRRKRTKVFAVAGLTAVAVSLMVLLLWSARVARDRSATHVATTSDHDVAPHVSKLEPGATTADRTFRPTLAQAPSPKAEVERATAPEISPSTISRAMAPGELRLRMLLARSRARSSSEADELIHGFLAHRVAEPDGDLEGLIQPLLARRAELEQRLLGQFHRFAGEQQSAAIELLGRLGGRASMPLLLQLRLRPSTHVVAVRALLNIADARTLARLALTEGDLVLRKEITAALRDRGDRQTLSFVLATEGERPCLEPDLESWLRSESL
jgi:hypothetical protein